MDRDELYARAIALYDRFTHETRDRRAFMADLIKLAGCTAAANALLMAIAADPAAATIVSPEDPRLETGDRHWFATPGREMSGYWARPRGERSALPTVMVFHENRGLTEHIRDVARRVALEGFNAFAPDFLSAEGGTPANEDEAREKIAHLDLRRTVADAVSAITWLGRPNVPTSSTKVGAVGFCWGGALVNRVAIAAGPALKAGVAYYGPAPDPAEARYVRAAMLLHYAGLDERVNATGRPWAAALKAAHVPVQAFVYPRVNHAFNNDTSRERYDAAAARLAWGRTIAFLRRTLA